MKKVTLVVALLTMFIYTLFAQTTKVLFVGNSLTYVNNLPQTFKRIAHTKGYSTEVSMHAPGGVGFADHVQNEALYALFREGGWDYIVLQPGTGDSAGEAYGGATVNTTVHRVRLLLDSIYRYNPCAQVLFYEISNGVRGNASENIAEYNHSMDIIFANTLAFADSTHLSLAPVGEGFRTSWNHDSTLMLWNSYNDVHPNSKGSYMAACVFYAAIFNELSFGTTEIDDLSTEEAAYFQHLADSLVLNHQSEWRLGRLHTNNFSVASQGGLSYSFTNLSRGYDSLQWDFGDGNTSDEINPFYTYHDMQDYLVRLSTWKGSCALTSQYNLGQLGIIDTTGSLPIKLYPNPCVDVLHIQCPEQLVTYKVLNLAGQMLKQGRSKQINISDIKMGVYMLQLSIQGRIYYQKFIKTN